MLGMDAEEHTVLWAHAEREHAALLANALNDRLSDILPGHWIFHVAGPYPIH